MTHAKYWTDYKMQPVDDDSEDDFSEESSENLDDSEDPINDPFIGFTFPEGFEVPAEFVPPPFPTEPPSFAPVYVPPTSSNPIISDLIQKYRRYFQLNGDDLVQAIVDAGIRSGDPTSIYPDLELVAQQGYPLYSRQFNFRTNKTGLHLAAREGSFQLVEFLLRLGIPVDLPDYDGDTALHYAARNHRLNVVETLLRFHATIDPLNNQHETPLFFAAEGGDDDIIRTLVQSGSTAIDIPNHVGNMPMHRAALRAHANTIELLARLGSHAYRARNKYGSTPFHEATTSTMDRWDDQKSSEFREYVASRVKTLENLVRFDGLDQRLHQVHRIGGGPILAIESAIDLRNNKGETPLILLTEVTHQSKETLIIIETLVRLGSAAIDIPDNGGNSPLDWLIQNIVLALDANDGDFNDTTDTQRTITLLRALGATRNQYIDFATGTPIGDNLMAYFQQTEIPADEIGPLYQEVINILMWPIPEEFVDEVRWRVYFSHSQLDRLLDATR